MADVEKVVGIRIEVTDSGGTQAANTSTEKLANNLKNVETQTQKVGKTAKETGGQMAAGFKSLEQQAGALPGPIGNIATAFGGVREGVMGFAKGLGTLKGAIMATGIGALAVVLGSLAAYFSESEKGAQKLRVATAFLKGVMEAFMGILEKIGGALVETFEEPEQALKKFGEGVKSYVLDNLKKIVDAGGLTGKVMGQVFSGDFSGALNTAKEATKKLADGILSLNPLTAVPYNLSKGLVAVGKDASGTANTFANLEAQLNKVKVAERNLTIERAESNKTIAEARFIADDATKSTAERIAAVKKAGELEEMVAAKEQVIAKERLRILEESKKAGKEEEEQNDQIAAANVRVIDLERETLTRQRRLQNEITSLKNEEIAKINESEAAKKAAADAELARLAVLAKENEAAKKANEAAKEAAEAAELARLDVLAKANEDYMEGLQKRFEEGMETDRKESERLLAMTQQTEDIRISLIQDAQLREEMEIISAFDRKMATIQGQGEQEAALRLALTAKMNVDLAAIEKRYAAESIKTSQQIATAKLTAAQAAGSGLINIGKVVTAAMADNAEVAKGIATAEVWINAATATASAISKAVQSSVTPYDMIANIATAVGVVAGAIASTIEIMNKADIPGGGGGDMGSMPSFNSTAPNSQPVSTNVTGLVNTQQAELQPLQAFVVETQMSGSQANVAQIYSQATFGLGG